MPERRVDTVQFHLRELSETDFEACERLWVRCSGIVARPFDGNRAFARLLRSNPRLCWCFEEGNHGPLAATVLAGQDGWRGSLYHLAVAPAWRRHGLARTLVERVLDELARLGIPRAHANLLRSNLGGRAFWGRAGWVLRDELVVLSRDVAPPAAPPAENA